MTFGAGDAIIPHNISAMSPAHPDTQGFGGVPECVIAEIEAMTRNRSERLGTLNDLYWQSACAFDGYAMLGRLTIAVVEMYGTAGWRDDTLTQLHTRSSPNIYLRWIAGAGYFLLHECPDRYDGRVANEQY